MKMDTVDAAQNLAVNDRALWVERLTWFKVLQDTGTEMTDNKKLSLYSGSKKVKTQNINHGERSFPNIYKLASLVLDLISKKRDTLI